MYLPTYLYFIFIKIDIAFISGLESFEKVLTTFKRAKHELGEILSSCELIDALSLEVVTKGFNVKAPIDEYPFHMLLETHGSSNIHDEEKMGKFVVNLIEDGVVEDGVVTNEPSKMKVGDFN